MATRTRRFSWDTVSRLRRLRRVQTAATFGLVVLGPVLALVTYLVMGPLDQGASSNILRIVLLSDLVYVIMIAALVMQQLMQMIAARRRRSAGSRLHLRLTGVFAIMALAPTITVAVFATLSVNMGLEAWFSDRVGRVVDNSVAAAQAYEDEHRRDLVTDAQALASVINAMVLAVPMTPQVPAVGTSSLVNSSTSASSISPARYLAQKRRQSVQAPTRSP